MKIKSALKIIISSWTASVIANGLIYALYFNPVIESVIFGKRYQSDVFLTVWNNPDLNKYIFAAGLVLFSTAFGILYHLFHPVIKGKILSRGAKFGGLVIFSGHYLQQEFYTPLMLLREPVPLFLLELLLLFFPCIVHGMALAWIYHFLERKFSF